MMHPVRCLPGSRMALSGLLLAMPGCIQLAPLPRSTIDRDGGEPEGYPEEEEGREPADGGEASGEGGGGGEGAAPAARADGEPCSRNGDCLAAHCQNGHCCVAGDCCVAAADCPGKYAAPPSCDRPAECQGFRLDPQCEHHRCTLSEPIDDDRACDDRVAVACGLYPPLHCTGAADQTAPSCRTDCRTDDGCLTSAHCTQNHCVADLAPGRPCTRVGECEEGLSCIDGVCCTTSCRGLCERCDLAGNGTCTTTTAGRTATCRQCEGQDARPPCNGCPAGVWVPTGWVCVPSGTYTLGSPAGEVGRAETERQHEVRLTRPFLLKATEVTQAEWVALMISNPSWFWEGGSGGCAAAPCAERPVESILWYEAVAYCNLRSQAEGLERCYQDEGGADYDGEDAAASVLPRWPRGPDCTGYRLPTEAEWEAAARARSTTATPAGNLDPARLECATQEPTLDRIAWYCGNSEDRSHAVATRAANDWGLHDMLGNVFEACWDWFGAYPAGPLRDPLGPGENVGRVTRGGSWNFTANHSRSAARNYNEPAVRNLNLGFRPARTVP